MGRCPSPVKAENPLRFKFCDEHSCSVDDCNGIRITGIYEDIGFCFAHRCEKTGCSNAKITTGDFCHPHTCKVETCTTFASSTTGNTNDPESHNYCEYHRFSRGKDYIPAKTSNPLATVPNIIECSAEGCYRNREHGEWCINHVCTHKACLSRAVADGHCENHRTPHPRQIRISEPNQGTNPATPRPIPTGTENKAGQAPNKEADNTTGARRNKKTCLRLDCNGQAIADSGCCAAHLCCVVPGCVRAVDGLTGARRVAPLLCAEHGSSVEQEHRDIVEDLERWGVAF